MGGERVEPILLDFEMDVWGPHRAAVRGREHFSNSAVGRDWIAFGEDRFEAEATIVVRAKGGAQPCLVDRPMLVLDIVKALGVGVPCVDFSTGDRMAVRYDLTGDLGRFARHPLGDVGPGSGPLRRSRRLAWSKHRLLVAVAEADMALGANVCG